MDEFNINPQNNQNSAPDTPAEQVQQTAEQVQQTYPQPQAQPYQYGQPSPQTYQQTQTQQTYQYGQYGQQPAQPYGIYGQQAQQSYGMYAQQQPRGNGLAIASLICGIIAAAGVVLCCCCFIGWFIPLILGVLSLIFGIAAKAMKTEKSGQAIGGIILGVLCILLSGAFGLFFFTPSDAITENSRESLLQNGFDENEVDEFLSQKRSLSDIIGFIFEHADEVAEAQARQRIDGFISGIEDDFADGFENGLTSDEDYFEDALIPDFGE